MFEFYTEESASWKRACMYKYTDRQTDWINFFLNYSNCSHFCHWLLVGLLFIVHHQYQLLAVFDSGLTCTNMAYKLGMGGIEQNSFAMQWYTWALTEY